MRHRKSSLNFFRIFPVFPHPEIIFKKIQRYFLFFFKKFTRGFRILNLFRKFFFDLLSDFVRVPSPNTLSRFPPELSTGNGSGFFS